MPILGNAKNIRRQTFVKAKPAPTQKLAKELLPELSDSEPDTDNEEVQQKQDPDWRLTPFFRKIRKITVSSSSINV